jgi:hypothetical protein
MAVLLIFLGLVFVGDAVAIGIASIVDQFSKSAGLLVFLGLFVSVFVVAWVGAVHITERYVLRVR